MFAQRNSICSIDSNIVPRDDVRCRADQPDAAAAVNSSRYIYADSITAASQWRVHDFYAISDVWYSSAAAGIDADVVSGDPVVSGRIDEDTIRVVAADDVALEVVEVAVPIGAHG